MISPPSCPERRGVQHGGRPAFDEGGEAGATSGRSDLSLTTWAGLVSAGGGCDRSE